MKTLHKVERYVLLVGDVFFLYISLYITLLLRYAKFPDTDILGYHLLPFSILFIFWVISFFIAGLYEKHTTILKNKLPQIILNTEIINSVVAVLFFYFIPYLTITPKASLFIFLIVSLVFIFVWRLWLFERVFSRWNNEKKSNAILVATGDEMKELVFRVLEPVKRPGFKENGRKTRGLQKGRSASQHVEFMAFDIQLDETGRLGRDEGIEPHDGHRCVR